MTPGQRKNWPVGSKPEVRNGLQDSNSEPISVEEALPAKVRSTDKISFANYSRDRVSAGGRNRKCSHDQQGQYA